MHTRVCTCACVRVWVIVQVCYNALALCACVHLCVPCGHLYTVYHVHTDAHVHMQAGALTAPGSMGTPPASRAEVRSLHTLVAMTGECLQSVANGVWPLPCLQHICRGPHVRRPHEHTEA